MDLTVPPAAQDLRALSLPHTRGCPRSWRELTGLLRCDFQRYCDSLTLANFVRHYVFSPGFRYTIWMRACGYFKVKRLLRLTVYPFAKLHLLHLRYKFGFVIPEYTAVGPGLFLNRFGGVYINGDSIIGCNVNISPGTVLGQSNRGSKMGSPIIGDRVFLGQGCKVVGRVFVGDEAVVGTGSVVTRDVPDRGVAMGMPAKVQSTDGSDGYVNRLADLAAITPMIRREPRHSAPAA